MNSTQIILFILASNLIIGVMLNIDGFNGWVTEFNTKYNNHYEDFKDEEKTWTSNALSIVEGWVDSFGSVISMGKILKDVALQGLNPFSIEDEDSEGIFSAMEIAIAIFRTMMAVVLIVEIYMIFKNRQTR